MKERPILFSGPMVRAILEWHKTQTRRVMKPQLLQPDGARHKKLEVPNVLKLCPYGKPGDRLWVRETWLARGGGAAALYRADYEDVEAAGLGGLYGGWKPSIFMPRWASRITLEVVNVRVERVQDITEADAIAEGVTCEERGEKCSGFRPPGNTSIDPEECPSCIDGYIPIYQRLWDSINSKRGFGWETNPWVWVIKFKRL